MAAPTRTPEDSDRLYPELARQMAALVAGEPDWLPNLANAAALLAQSLPRVSWVGFYLARGGELVLGPFIGRPACLRIPFGQGVCGTAFRLGRSLVVPDVRRFPGHIVCDPRSRSELVVPLIQGGRPLGVLDLDSTRLGRFREADARGLEEVLAALTSACDLTAATQPPAAQG